MAATPAPGGTRKVLPGFNLTLGYTLVYLGLVVLIPFAALTLKSLTLTADQFWAAVSSPRVLAAYRLTFGASLIAAAANAVILLGITIIIISALTRLVDIRKEL